MISHPLAIPHPLDDLALMDSASSSSGRKIFFPREKKMGWKGTRFKLLGDMGRQVLTC